MKVVFAKTRYAYDSYRDFWKLVELSGFDTCFVDEIDLPLDIVYITTPVNGELRPHMDHRRSILKGPQRAKIIWWNLERPDSDGQPPITDVITDILRYVDAVWVSDRHYASLDKRMHHVVLGSHAGLCRDHEPYPAQYDYTHQSYVWGRREAIFFPLRMSGLREGPNGWFEERDCTLRSSRLIVNVHQTKALIGEPLRFAVTSAYRMAMVSETLADNYPFVPSHDHIQASFENLVETVRSSLGRNDLAEMGRNLFHRLCVEWTFSRGVREGIASTRF